MTDREFDELLKTAFDRYARETLSQIPDIPDFSKGYCDGDPAKDDGYARLMAKIARGERPRSEIADSFERTDREWAHKDRIHARKSPERTIRRRGRALALLSAACLALLCLTVFLAAKIAGQPQNLIPSDPADVSRPDPPDSKGDATVPVQSGGAALSPSPDDPNPPQSGQNPAFTDPSGANGTVNDVIEFEQVFPEYFHSPGTQNNTGDSGDFADPGLVVEHLPLLTPENTEEKRAFEKRTGGSIVFWSGQVELFLSYDRPVLPVAVTYTFDDPDLLPRSCVLMGKGEDGWVELQSYACKISSPDVSVAFYLDAQSADQPTGRYAEFCLSYRYTAMPDERYQVPTASLYGFTGKAQSFGFARYSVSSGVLYALSTNLRELTLPDSFAGNPLRAVRRGAISGVLSPDLTRLNIPEGVTTLEVSSFLGCGELTEIGLPGSFSTLSPGSSWSQSDDLYAEEIRKNADLDGNGTVGAPLSALFEDCPALSAVDVAPDHPTLISKNGEVFLRDGKLRLFPDSKNG